MISGRGWSAKYQASQQRKWGDWRNFRPKGSTLEGSDKRAWVVCKIPGFAAGWGEGKMGWRWPEAESLDNGSILCVCILVYVSLSQPLSLSLLIS